MRRRGAQEQPRQPARTSSEVLSLVCSSPEWAESLTEMGKGKHFIGDFLPPEELEKFMETFKALKVSFPPSGSLWGMNQDVRSVVLDGEL